MLITVNREDCTVRLVNDDDSSHITEHKLFFSEFVFPESYFVLSTVLRSIQELEPYRVSVDLINDDGTIKD
jgi:hypothetical protein